MRSIEQMTAPTEAQVRGRKAAYTRTERSAGRRLESAARDFANAKPTDGSSGITTYVLLREQLRTRALEYAAVVATNPYSKPVR